MKLLTLVGILLTTIQSLAQGATPSCCDVLVRGYDNSGVGINCTPGGIDCAFSGQMTATCDSVNSFTRIGNNCQPA
jgi:hypothetical protein